MRMGFAGMDELPALTFRQNSPATRFLLASSLLLVISVDPLLGQSSNQATCRQPEGSKATLRMEAAEAEHVPEIRVVDLRFEGTPTLALSEQNQIAAEIMEVVEEDRKGWQESVQERVRYAWQVRGFFHVQVQTASRELSSSPEVKNVALTFQIEAGAQYHLGHIRFKNARQLTDPQLRRFFPIDDGEILKVDKIAEGIEAMRRAYGELGFINFTAVPETVDERNERILLNLDLDEGKQFHISSIKVLGENQKLIAPLLRQYKIEPGEIFDVRRVEEFSRRLGIHAEDDIERVIDEKNASVCLLISLPDSSD